MKTINQIPLVSICIPTYNSGAFIRETLHSVLNQTYSNIEVNISDDASSDNTLTIIESFKDSRINIIKNLERIGLEENWNTALRMATGKYIKFLCADDIIKPTCVEKQVAVLENDHNIVLVVCQSNVISPIGKPIVNRPRRLKAGLNNSKIVVKKCLLWGSNVLGEPNVGLFRADAVHDIRFSGVNPYMIDLGFWVQLLKVGVLFVQKEQLAFFRTSPDALTTKIGKSQAKMYNDFVDKLYKDKYWGISFPLIIWSKIIARLMQTARCIILKKQFK